MSFNCFAFFSRRRKNSYNAAMLCKSQENLVKVGTNESEKRERKLIALLWAPFSQFDFDTLFFEHPACRKLNMYDSLSLRSRILFGDTFKGGGGPPMHCAKTPLPTYGEEQECMQV